MRQPSRPAPDRTEVIVRGTVQGVGFRPFVYRLATELGLAGDVRNDGGDVVIRVAASGPALAGFVERLRTEGPEHSRVDTVSLHTAFATGGLGPGFAVLRSTGGNRGSRALPPDLATCAACLRELFDPSDRRYRYPFLNCTDCGPRASIVDTLPYDAIDEALRIIDAYETPNQSFVDFLSRPGVGHGATEAPRGTLYHRYEIDDQGLITSAVIVPPTAQNQAAIGADLAKLVQANLNLDNHTLTHLCEQAIRNYDPCIPCSAHFLELTMDRQ